MEEIIEALIRPALVDETSGEGRGDDFIRMITRLNHEPSDSIKALRVKHLLPLVVRFDAAILKAVPGLAREELFWRMHFLLGALHHGLDRWVGREQMPVPPGVNRKKLQIDGEGFIVRFVAFAAAGLRASAPLTPLPIRVRGRATPKGVKAAK